MIIGVLQDSPTEYNQLDFYNNFRLSWIFKEIEKKFHVFK